MSGRSYINDSLRYNSLSSLQATIMKKLSEAEFNISNKLCCYVQINSAKDVATGFNVSTKLCYPSPPERLSKINLLCKQKKSRIKSQIKSKGNEKPCDIAGIRYIPCSLELSSTVLHILLHI